MSLTVGEAQSIPDQDQGRSTAQTARSFETPKPPVKSPLSDPSVFVQDHTDLIKDFRNQVVWEKTVEKNNIEKYMAAVAENKRKENEAAWVKAVEENKRKEQEKAFYAYLEQQEQAKRLEELEIQERNAESNPPYTIESSDCPPPSGDSGLQPWVAVVRSMVAVKFGITNIGGTRPGDPRDHGKGLALDVMVPIRSVQGDEVAQWAIDNIDTLNLDYVIWKQQIYTARSRSWRGMSDRGSITANHYDHVHLSFKPGPGTCIK